MLNKMVILVLSFDNYYLGNIGHFYTSLLILMLKFIYSMDFKIYTVFIFQPSMPNLRCMKKYDTNKTNFS